MARERRRERDLGSIELNHVVHNSDSVVPDVAEPWLTSDAQPRQYRPDGSKISQQILHHYTFNTPVGAAPTPSAGAWSTARSTSTTRVATTRPSPASATQAAHTPQEKVLMFMLFDLASCVQTDKEPPEIPVIR